MRRLLKVDLGCGTHKCDPDFVGVDIDPSSNPDMVYDLTLGMPFEKDSISEVHSSHFFEHIPSDKVLLLMNDMAEQCVNRATIKIVVPLNFKDISHKEVLGFDWIGWLVKSIPSSIVLRCYEVETCHANSILPEEFGKPFFYDQATTVFRVCK